MRTIRITILVLSLVVTGNAGAQSKVGTSVGQFLGIEPSARHAGMGNAGSASPVGIEAVYFNPGAIGTLTRPAFQFSHGAWFTDILYNYASAAAPIGTFGTLFASVTTLNSGEIAVRTVAQPLGTGERFTVGDFALGLGYGRQVTDRFAVGVQWTYARERIWNSSQSFQSFSAGTVYRVGRRGFTIGSSVSNMGTDSRFSGRDLAFQYDNSPDVFGDNGALPGEQLTGDFPVPILARFGVSMPYRFNQRSVLLFAVDALHPSDNAQSVNTGAEWSWKDTLALRGGYQTLFQDDSELGLTFGFGLHGTLQDTDFRFDYAWAGHEHLNETHRFTLILEL
ncbi:PorV/PorQ family protein [bacterium]|nr:PorV/PorQ family protein [bacterium]